MTSRITSAILRRTSSIRRSNFGGLKGTIRASINTDPSYGSNEYIHKSFFDDENYQSIIKCLDGGYEISKDLLEYMQDYHDLLQNNINHLSSYTNKWKSKLKQQSSLSSYHTTKRAQLQIIRSPEKLAQLIESRCTAIQEVITAYRKQVDRMYPSERLGTVRKHYRMDTMKKLFKTAHSSLSKVSEKLEKVREDEKKAQAALLEAKIQCENLSLDETASKNKLRRANDNQDKRQDELQFIQEKLSRVEEEFRQAQEIYHEKLIDVYQQCRELEKERLDQIRQALIEFIQAIHTSEYSTEQNALYADLLSKIETQQDSIEDLDFWAQIYSVNVLAKSISSETDQNVDDNNNIDSQTTVPKTKKSQKKETVDPTTSEENTLQPVAENQEEQSLADKPATTVKTKVRKNKNNTTEPTTPNATGLNQV